MADTAGQSAADNDAAARRKAELESAADQLAAQRDAEDKATASRRTAEDRVLASSRARLSVAASAVQSAATAVSRDAEPDNPHAADLRTAVAELHAALTEHLDLAPEPPAADTDRPRKAQPGQPGQPGQRPAQAPDGPVTP
jgi:hypothetical protein